MEWLEAPILRIAGGTHMYRLYEVNHCSAIYCHGWGRAVTLRSLGAELRKLVVTRQAGKDIRYKATKTTQ